MTCVHALLGIIMCALFLGYYLICILSCLIVSCDCGLIQPALCTCTCVGPTVTAEEGGVVYPSPTPVLSMTKAGSALLYEVDSSSNNNLRIYDPATLKILFASGNVNCSRIKFAVPLVLSDMVVIGCEGGAVFFRLGGPNDAMVTNAAADVAVPAVPQAPGNDQLGD